MTGDASARTGDRLLRTGRNCWRVARADRAALLVDGEAYFSSLRRAAVQAKRSIFIIGWDVDSRTYFPPDGEDDGLPRTLGQFLNALVARNRNLHVYVLDWDFAFLYALDREVLPIYSRGWRGHGRLHFRLDDCHPPGGSHHQKLVVLDDALAFVGGIDLTKARWDTPRHAPGEPHRRTPSGAPYAPFHDMQLMVDGETAAALGELARKRWQCATGRDPKSDRASPGESLWPSSVAPHFEDVQVGIARTQPAYEGAEPQQEVLRLYLDGIRAARRWIYIENQYFTAPAIGRAIEERLVEPNGPEIVIVTRLTGGGWLEQATMEVLRARLIKRLQPKDRQGRLRVYFPDQAGLGDQCIDLHSKLMIVDDRLLRVGSSNLNNRSMGVDSECDLAIEAQAPQQSAAIASIRNRLLAEHLDVEPRRVAQELEQHGSLIKAIEVLTGNARTLKTLEPTLSEEVDALVPDAETIDPEQPVDPDRLVEQIVPHEERPRTSKRIIGGALVLLAFAAFALAWRWGPLHEWLDRDTLRALADTVERSRWTPLWMLGVYVVAALTAMPIMLLIVATALVFDPLTTCAYAMAGSLLGAALTFGIGQSLGHRAVRQIAGQRVNALSRRLGEGGVFAVTVLRILPIAPFTVVNFVAGASRLRMRDFLLGTALGMTPGVLAAAVFSDRLGAALRDPSPATVLLLCLALVAIGLVALAIRSWLRRHSGARVEEHR